MEQQNGTPDADWRQQVETLRAERDAALAQHNSEYSERIGHQAATIEVLKAMSASPGDPQPVFDLIVQRARDLCGSYGVSVHEFDGEMMKLRAWTGVSDDPAVRAAYVARFPRVPTGESSAERAILERRVVHIRDMATDAATAGVLAYGTIRSVVAVPMLRGGSVIGALGMGNLEPGGFSDTQVQLLQTFAEQAVIAITSAETYRALAARTSDLQESLEQQTATADILRVINTSPDDLRPVFSAILEKAHTLCGAAIGNLALHENGCFRALATHGYPEAVAATLRQPIPATRRQQALVDGKRYIQDADIRATTVGHESPWNRAVLENTNVRTGLWLPLRKDSTLLGFITSFREEVRPFTEREITLLENFAAQAVIAMENARLLNEIRTARDEAESTLTDLQRTQDRLVQTEKMASLGQLTAGIAHEIKNPLNFVNNFSDLSVDLLDELNAAVAPEKITLPEETRTEIDEITTTLQGNLRKIIEHGRRADSIVKNMLLHSRTGTSERRIVDLNSIAEEALNLAYHGARAETQGFNITLQKDLDPAVGMVEIYPQEISRVLVNLFSNGFYAAHQRTAANPGFEPTLRLSTRSLGERIEIRVRDNGTGIPAAIRDKIFEPFFTTKPAGQGTGLGLSLSFDIVVKQHGGQLGVASAPGEFTEFTITLPRQIFTQEGDRA